MAQSKTKPHREAMGGLAKGLAVIRAFTRDHAAMSLSEIARIAGMPAATARRCLLTLEELGYVTRNGRSFLLRPKVMELGAAYLESIDIEKLTKTHLEELARITSDSSGALRTRRCRRRLRGTRIGPHLIETGGARRQPLSGARHFHGAGAPRRRERGATAVVLRNGEARGADR